MSFDLFDSPELLDIQREGFYRFLNQGISHLLSKQFPIKVKNGSSSIELWLNEQNIKLIAPDSSPRDCILNMKTYSCKLYAQVKIVCKKQGSDSALKTQFAYKAPLCKNHLLCNSTFFAKRSFATRKVQKGMEKTCKASHAPLQSSALYVQRNSPSQFVKNFAFGIQKARLTKLALQSGALYTSSYKAPYTRTKQSFVGTPFFASLLCSTQNNVKTCCKARLTKRSFVRTSLQSSALYAKPHAKLCFPVQTLRVCKGFARVCKERGNINKKLFSSAGLLSLSNNKQNSILYESIPEWVLLGQLPMMTKRGHFIINGSPRVIVHQVVRSPGIYFQKVVKKEDQNFARFYGDIIPLKGVWVRLQMTKKGRIEAKFKKGKKVQVEFLQKCLQVIEDQASLSESYCHDRADVARTKLVQTQLRTKRNVASQSGTVCVEEQSFIRAKSINLKFSSSHNLLYEDFLTLLDKRKNRAISKAEHDAFIYTYDKLYRTTQDKELEEWQRKKNNLYFFKGLNPENAFKRKKCSENLFASFKIASRYDLGSLGREKINDKFGLDLRTKLRFVRRCNVNYTNTKLTNSVDCYCTEPRLYVQSSALLAKPCKERGRSLRVKQALKKNQYLITQQRLEKEPELYNCIGKEQQLTAMDLSAASVWLYKLRKGEKFTDDIDHSQNRRVRTSGELLETQFENGVDRLKILLSTKLKEWRTSFSDPTFSSLFKSSYRIRYNDQSLFKRCHQISFAGFQNTKIKKFQDSFNEKFYKISVKEVFSTKPITGALREFFGSNPLSQYMDQTNPLAEITHKRRISSLGVGGVSRESAGMAIRGIHPTHYGRICPIETPEGKNAGLVNSLAFYTKVDVNGFLKTPYYRVVKGQIQSCFGFSFTSAKEELLTGLYIAPSDLQKSSNNILRTKNTLLETVPVRVTDNQLDVFKKESPNKVKLIGISPIQMISVATSLIPFLEHNDANRALMGSNMQRQAVPLMIAERPIVGTGLESIVIVESGHITESQTSGFAGEVTASRIIIDRLCLHAGKRSRALYEKVPKVSTLHVQSSALYRCMRCFAYKAELCKEVRTKLRFVSRALHRIPERCAFGCFAPCKAPLCKAHSLRSEALHGVLRTKRSFVRRCNAYKPFQSSATPCKPFGFAKGLQGEAELCMERKERGSFFKSSKNYLTTFSRSNQNTCITEKPLIQEFDWVQRGDILSDCSASNNGELAVGKNVLVAYIPWEGYNFEDAIVISERLVREHVYTSLHIERYTFQAQDLKDGNEWFTKNLPGIEDRFVEHLEESGLPKIGSFLREGDIIVGKIRYLNKKPSSPYERLLCDILGEKNFAARNKSLYVPKGVEARVIYHRVINQFDNEPDNKVRPARAPRTINVFLGEKRVIQVGDKISGRHGNKGVISTILPRQDMPYLPDGTPIDVILNPLGVPSRMNVGQVLECLLGLAANYLNQHFKITAFDERYGVEASKSIVFLKLYQARLQSGQNWLFQVNFPGKTRLVDGRSGLCFDQWITVGKAYILKLIHMVSEKIHARSTGPYALITQQPLRGRSNKGGQRLGEMEVWALEGFGAAYTLQELLTKKSDDFFGRKQIVDSILPNPSSIVDTLKPDFRIHQSRPVLGHPEIFKVLLCELQALCLDLGVYIVTPESFQRSFLGIVH